MIRKDLSVTSNIAKLLKHLNTLEKLQHGKVTPIMVHAMLTHRCQLNCVHCCFKNRQNKKADIKLEVFIEAMRWFRELGTKSIELTGGGDPVLYPQVNTVLRYLKQNKWHIGVITNGLGGSLVDHWEWFDWVRVSLNTLDYQDDLELGYLNGIPTSFCYIWNENSPKRIGRVIDYANEKQTICRLAPDCIMPTWLIEKQLDSIRETMSRYPDNEYVFLSDFNIQTKRKNHNCYIHMIKPCFYIDGWVYSCPSAELAYENDKQIQNKTRICRYDKIYEFYTSDKAIQHKSHDCSYCKYVDQQELLEALLAETEFNEFA